MPGFDSGAVQLSGEIWRFGVDLWRFDGEPWKFVEDHCGLGN
jgi:hypothetical protein